MKFKKRLPVLTVLIILIILGWRTILTFFMPAEGAYDEFKTTQLRETTNSALTLIPKIPDNTNLLIIINTIPSKFERRRTLRETWAKQASFPITAHNTPFKSNSTINISYFFMMAFHGSSIDKDLEKESAVHGDILRVNLSESYRGMVNKILLTFEWVTTLDVKPNFIAKADDDVYVKMPDLARWLQENSHLTVNLYTGFIIHRPVRVKRQNTSRYFVSLQQYEDDFFPLYCLGPFYIFSRDVFLGIVNASKVIETFAVEDALMGVLVKKIGMKPMHTGTRLYHKDRHLNKLVLKSPADKTKLPSGIVLGDSLSSAAIQRIHSAYTGS